MPYVGGEYSEQDLLQELKKTAREQGVRTYEEYIDMVDEIIEEKRGYGFFSANEDLVQLRSTLEERWKEIKPER